MIWTAEDVWHNRKKEFNQGLVESWGTKSEFSQSCTFHRDISVAKSFALEIIQTQNSARKCVLPLGKYIAVQQRYRLAKSSPKSQLQLMDAEPPVHRGMWLPDVAQ